jgi:hypothetical protein
MLCRATLVRSDVSEEISISIKRVTRIGELGRIVFLRSVSRLLVIANVPSSPILIIMMMEALCSSENIGSYKSHTA